MPWASAAAIALFRGWVSGVGRSSRSIRLRPSWPPSVVGTRLAAGMNADVAGIFSSARFRFAIVWGLFLQVGRPLHLPRRSRLQLFALALGRRHAVLDGLADRVIRVGDHLPRPLRGVASALDRLAAAQLHGLAAQAVYLLLSRTPTAVRPGDD